MDWASRAPARWWPVAGSAAYTFYQSLPASFQRAKIRQNNVMVKNILPVPKICVLLHRRLREYAYGKKKLNCLTNYHLEVNRVYLIPFCWGIRIIWYGVRQKGKVVVNL